MNKYTIGIIVVLAVIATGAFLLFRDGTGNMMGEVKITTSINKENSIKNTNSTEETDTTTKGVDLEEIAIEPVDMSTNIIITYTDDGFSPSLLTIKKGEAVKFVNKSEKNMWPASNSRSLILLNYDSSNFPGT